MERGQFDEQYHAGQWNLYAAEHGHAAVYDAADGCRRSTCTRDGATDGQHSEWPHEWYLFRGGQMDWRAMPRDYAMNPSVVMADTVKHGRLHPAFLWGSLFLVSVQAL
jgi:hypothetical protein